MRITRALMCGLVVVGSIVAAAPGASAGTPYPVNMRVNMHKVVEVYPDWVFETPCFRSVGVLTEVVTAQAHVVAAGIDPSTPSGWIAPYHATETVTETILFEPYDPSHPTLTGRASVHVTNEQDNPNAGFTNTVLLRGSDGSRYVFHENVHVLVKPNGIDLTVWNRQPHCWPA